jgi:hypothetical protein
MISGAALTLACGEVGRGRSFTFWVISLDKQNVRG